MEITVDLKQIANRLPNTQKWLREESPKNGSDMVLCNATTQTAVAPGRIVATTQ